MIHAARQFNSAEEIRANAAAVRNRLMRPANAFVAPKPVVVLKVVKSIPEAPLWQRETITFSHHVRVWQWYIASKKSDPYMRYVLQRCDELGVSFEEMSGSGRNPIVVNAKQTIIWELKTLHRLSFPRIGRIMGRDHSSMISSYRKACLKIEGKISPYRTKSQRVHADKELTAKLRRQYEAGWSIQDLTKAFSISREIIVAVAKAEGWYDPDRALQRAKNHAAMRRDYEAGMPIKQLVAKYGIAERTWQHIKTKLGIPQRPHFTKIRGEQE